MKSVLYWCFLWRRRKRRREEEEEEENNCGVLYPVMLIWISALVEGF